MCSPIGRRMRESVGDAAAVAGRRRCGLGSVRALDVQRRVLARPPPRGTRARPACARARRDRCRAPRVRSMPARRRSAARRGVGVRRARRRRRAPAVRRAPAGRSCGRAAVAAVGEPSRPPAPGRRDAADAIRASTSPTGTVSSTATSSSATIAAARRRHLGVDLVGRDLADRLVGRDPVAAVACATRPACPRRPTRPSAASTTSTIVAARRVSRRGAHGTPPGRARRLAAPPARAAARTGSARRASRRARPGRRGRSKPCSAISAATCAPAAHVELASSTITTFEQRATESRIASSSSGTSERRSSTSIARAVEILGRLERGVHHRAVGDHDQVGARPRDARAHRRLVDARRAPRRARGGRGACAR